MFGFGPDMIYAIPGLLIALTVHEYAHAKVADNLGDFTPRMNGRLTLNPVAHIDPIGLIMLFFAQIGWAKPVPINLNNFDDWRKSEMQVSLAGPLANLITAFVASIFFALCFKYSFAPHWLVMVLQLIIIYNVNFAIFNLVPIPPLDGSKILSSLLPGRLAYKYQSSVVSRYSFFILIALVFTGILGFIIHPISNFIISILNLIISIII
ncbi:site-2 protease family protein [Megamonas rupellensis]|uniref:site-2 protease family protein n=1 Tax=Megamonas rupellensis TaxID=491921 RepID=UPI0019597BE4|nr:site-2 protease family protein [Megamonas rupellensis]MBM6748957.1 site-2 protease family protein [Megamonas rupellensis]